MALTDTLDDLITERRIEPQLAIKILANFDRSITEILAQQGNHKLSFKVTLNFHIPRIDPFDPSTAELICPTRKGHLHTYRFCDEVWTFLIEDVTFKMNDNTPVQADKVKIVSCNSKKPGEV